MSVLGSVLAFVFAVFGFLFSLPGLFVFLTGACAFLLLPGIPKATGELKQLAHVPLYLATTCLSRAAIVVSEHNDLLFKSMRFSDRGVEMIGFGDVEKEFEDPTNALHHWKGMPFALADEVHGILFDPRHAAVGQREHDAEEYDEMFISATDAEWDTFQVYGWVRGVFEMPEDTHEIVDLSMVRQLMTGIERAEWPDQVETMYKNSRLPYASKTGISRFFLPIAAFFMTFGGIWLIASQGGGGGGGDPDTTIGFGSSLALLVSTATLPEVDRKRAAVALGVGLPIPLILMLVAVFVNPILALLVFVVFTMGFGLLPVLSVLARPSSRLSGTFAQLFVMLGLIGFDRPVFEWRPEGYEIVEYEHLDDAVEVKWYGLANSLIGFTFEPGRESWDTEVIPNDTLTDQAAATDGGAPAQTMIPDRYRRFPELSRAVYAAFIPEKIKSSAYYLHSGICTSWFAHSATGEKSKKRLLDAKRKYGADGFGLSDKAVLYMTGGAGLIGVVLGVVLFLL